MAKNRGICAAHTCIPQYREYPPPPGENIFLPNCAISIDKEDFVNGMLAALSSKQMIEKLQEAIVTDLRCYILLYARTLSISCYNVTITKADGMAIL